MVNDDGLEMGLRVSEVYRGFTILYDTSSREWLIELTPEARPERFKAAFQARRAVNMLLDGQSIPWPKKEAH